MGRLQDLYKALKGPNKIPVMPQRQVLRRARMFRILNTD